MKSSPYLLAKQSIISSMLEWFLTIHLVIGGELIICPVSIDTPTMTV